MEWVTAVGSAVAAVAALVAAWQATRLVRKTQDQVEASLSQVEVAHKQVEVSQRQVELAQRELFANQRPLLVPVGSIAQMGAEGLYLDLHSATVAMVTALRNVGSGTALSTRLTVFGNEPKDPPRSVPPRRVAFFAQPIAAGETSVGISLTVGGSMMNGDVCINDEPSLTLFAPRRPTLNEVQFSTVYIALGRLTVTYSDVYARKHAAVWDLDNQQNWHFVASREDIPADLDDLNNVAVKAYRPTEGSGAATPDV